MAEIITFFGGDSQVGLTLLTQSIAQGLKSRAKKCLVIFASSEIDEGYLPTEKAGNLGTLLRLSKVEYSDVMPCIEKGSDFDYIKGPSDILKKQFFSAELLDDISKLLTREYDYILIDAGHDVTLPLCVGALMLANRRFYVLTGSEKCIARYKASSLSVIDGLGVDTEEDRLIINKENKKIATYLSGEMFNLLGKEGFSVPMYDNYLRCEVDKSTAFNRDNTYQKAILMITDEIMHLTPKGKR